MRVDSSFDTCLITDLLSSSSRKDTKSASTSPNVEEVKPAVETPKKPRVNPKTPTLTFEERMLATAEISRLRFLDELQKTLK